MRPIPTLPGYQIYRTGTVWSDKRNDRIAPYVRPGEYPKVTLMQNGRRRTFTVHSLVMLTFGPPKPLPAIGVKRMVIAHMDGDLHNCHISNLKWVPNGENQRHRKAHGTSRTNRPRKRIDKERILALVGKTDEAIAQIIGCSRSRVTQIRNGG